MSMLGWHFSAADRRLGYGDGRLIEAGQTLQVECEPVLCESGLHASSKLLDAVGNARGSYLWRVRLSGRIVQGQNKSVATERTALWGFDATGMLRHFARLCALDVSDKWSAPDVVVRYLMTGDESLRDAAREAARAAAWDATWDAAGAATWAATRAMARDGTRAATWAAAWDAAGDAAWAAALDAERGPAWDAAWGSAWDAARGSQNRRITSMACQYRQRAEDRA